MVSLGNGLVVLVGGGVVGGKAPLKSSALYVKPNAAQCRPSGPEMDRESRPSKPYNVPHSVEVACRWGGTEGSPAPNRNSLSESPSQHGHTNRVHVFTTLSCGISIRIYI